VSGATTAPPTPAPRRAADIRDAGPGPPATRRPRVRPGPARSWRSWDSLCDVARAELRRRPGERAAVGA
jgi:hypothetical protein